MLIRYEITLNNIRVDLTLSGPQSRFGDIILINRVVCPLIWECGVEGVNTSPPCPLFFQEGAGSVCDKTVILVQEFRTARPKIAIKNEIVSPNILSKVLSYILGDRHREASKCMIGPGSTRWNMFGRHKTRLLQRPRPMAMAWSGTLREKKQGSELESVDYF